MKVDGENPPIPYIAYRNQNPAEQLRTRSCKSAGFVNGIADDKVQLSARAREVQEAAKALAKLPEIHEEKVQQVKMEVENGTYEVVGNKVAVEMLKETFGNNILLNQIDMYA